MRTKGTLATWNDGKGYGFIQPMEGGSRVFIHITAFSNRARRPEVGDVVTYRVGKDSRGRDRAEGATLSGDRLREKSPRESHRPTVVVALAFLACVGISAILTDLPVAVPLAYVFVSLITFIAYALDKSAARNGRWRTSEQTLHLLAIAGGWPGALVAQQALRHKSKKASFRIVFWATVIINIALLVWLHTAEIRDNPLFRS